MSYVCGLLSAIAIIVEERADTILFNLLLIRGGSYPFPRVSVRLEFELCYFGGFYLLRHRDLSVLFINKNR